MPFFIYLFLEHVSTKVFEFFVQWACRHTYFWGGGLFVSAIDFSMSLAGRVHISVWELSTLKLLHFEQFTLQCHLVDYSNECPFAKFSHYNSWMLLYTCAMKPIFHVMITCPASFIYCKFVFRSLFVAPNSVSMRMQVYFQRVFGGGSSVCLSNLHFNITC